ncbi:NLR family CARD domain-containing protein 3-like isoform X3 [Sardina pilchardus]|uniref:NLR family CARD domain-containing protein 3-like isoform X3 n=1 Tax=Sardina pilchardus TaxID=27697 RepID=UPI002E15575F
MSDSQEREEAAGPSKTLRPESAAHGFRTMKNAEDMADPGSPTHSGGGSETHRPPSPVPSCVSMKSDVSMPKGPDFSNEPPHSESNELTADQSMGGVHEQVPSDTITCEHNINKNTDNEVLGRVKENHKASLKRRFENISEGIIKAGAEILLNEIYTELYITEGESEGVNKEHEVWQVESASREHTTEDKPINCNELFKPLPGQKKCIRTVMTKGVAGIGKTVSVQKFILDWTDGVANQDVDFMFPLPFRELNLVRGEQYSLHRLLLDFYPELKELNDGEEYKDCRVVLIFDGLDESRSCFDVQNNVISDLKQISSVDLLMTSLIQGTVFPSSLIWITSRPAAASQIPAQYVDRVTEIRGFNDPQKEEYFRKKISDESQANRIISHIKASRSLHIMCHIPVFCWIAATVLQQMLEQDNTQAIPTTLTEMFIHFLLIQTTRKNQKYLKRHEADQNKLLKSQTELILKLSELAFKNLNKGNLIFYEEDLENCGIDVSEASVYSGMCTEIFKEESVFHQRKVYCFVHLSIQEFLAALHVFISYQQRDLETLQSLCSDIIDWKILLYGLLKEVVEKALDSRNGHLDLFLRFLMGISLEKNQTLLKGLLNHTHHTSKSIENICQYIKELNRENLSPERCINLFHCLFEMNDHSMHQEIKKYLESPKDFKGQLSPAHCSALAHMLLMSEEVLDELIDLKKYNTSDEGRKRLIPAVRCFRKARLADCKLTDKSCELVASVLQSPNSLIELDLSDNDLGDSGVQLLSKGLSSPHCKLQTLRLCKCGFSSEGYVCLALALMVNPSCVKELDVSNNHPGESAQKLLSATMENPHRKVGALQLAGCKLTFKSCELVASVLQSPNSLIKLDLNTNDLGDSGAQLLSKGLSSPQCRLQTLSLQKCNIGEEGFTALASALRSNPSHIRRLLLMGSKATDSGVKHLSSLLEDPNCKLEELDLQNCNIGEEGFTALASALRSNPSHMRQLWLRGSKATDSGVKHLSSLLEDPNCKLEKLNLKNCSIGEEGFTALASALRSNPSHMRVLFLRGSKATDSGVKHLSSLLEDPKCKLEKLDLDNCSIGEEGFTALASALRSNPSHMRELFLRGSKATDSGVKHLSCLLEDPNCKLDILNLQSCSIGEEGFTALASALRSNPSHLRVLWLEGSKATDSGVKHLSCLLEDPNCKLETLDSSGQMIPNWLGCDWGFLCHRIWGWPLPRHATPLRCSGAGFPITFTLNELRRLQSLQNCSIGEEGFTALASALRSNPSHMRVLWLMGSKATDSGVKYLSSLLEDPNCKLEELDLRNCSIGEEGFTALASALRSNPSHMRVLKLLGSKATDSGVKHLSSLLEDPNCKLETLDLQNSSIGEEGFTALASALRSNPSHITRLLLMGSKATDSGVKHLSSLLEDPNCKLEELSLYNCSITDEGFRMLASALRSNPSTVRELWLGGNQPGPSAQQLLSELKKHPNCKHIQMHGV